MQPTSQFQDHLAPIPSEPMRYLLHEQIALDIDVTEP